MKPEKNEVLQRFMEEFFDFATLKKAGFYGKEIKKRDYKAQAERVCQLFGYKTVYEYGAKEIRCHITTEGPGEQHKRTEPFVAVITSIYAD